MKLTPTQQFRVDRARDLAAASSPTEVTACIEQAGGQVHGDDPYPEAFGLAAVFIGDLLDIIDALTE